ncbi:hypothetical protein AgCh_023550 [Apium graveolens]
MASNEMDIPSIDNQVEVVGFEDDFKTLKAELNSEDMSLKVISIHDMGGLGKTSLATKLYNSSELKNFDTHAKVCVSNEFDMKDVLKRIVKSFMGPEHEKYLSTMDEHDLLQYLPKLLQDRGRYLALKEHIWKQLKEDGSLQIEEILSLSYNNSSPQMRDCFLYLARYPEDHLIDPDDLKLLWIAEEFI